MSTVQMVEGGIKSEKEMEIIRNIRIEKKIYYLAG